MDACDALIVGAGPTGLTMAAQLHAYGVQVRLVDRALDRVHESRALGVQPRTLEVLRAFGHVTEEIVARGNQGVRLRVHAGDRMTEAPVFDIGMSDTAFPFLLFLSQAETEAVLGEYLAECGVQIERGVQLEGYAMDGGEARCRLRHGDGRREELRARYLVGCDGAHSTVREQAGIAFGGSRYPLTFMLADLDVDGLDQDTLNAFVTKRGPVLFFPLRRPAAWRLIARRQDRAAHPAGNATDPVVTGPVTLDELQTIVDEAAGGRLRLHDPVWATAFGLQHRLAEHYRSGPVFLAGDAAHIHSPAGAQGMNTGIQDAVNLGWKLGLVLSGEAPAALLDSYETERRPVGAFVLRFTDRAFTAATSTSWLALHVRPLVAQRLLPIALRLRAVRAAAFRTVSQLGIAYRSSPAVDSADASTGRRPRPGDRLPDAEVSVDGSRQWLQGKLLGPGFHLLLAGPADGWDESALATLRERYGARLGIVRLDRRPGADVLVDDSGAAVRRLGVRGHAQFVVRPDGHVGYRADRLDLSGSQRYLAQWLLPVRAAEPSGS